MLWDKRGTTDMEIAGILLIISIALVFVLLSPSRQLRASTEQMDKQPQVFRVILYER